MAIVKSKLLNAVIGLAAIVCSEVDCTGYVPGAETTKYIQVGACHLEALSKALKELQKDMVS